VRLFELPDDILSSDQRDDLERIGLTTCHEVVVAPDRDLKGVRDKNKLRAAASLGLLDMDSMLFDRLLPLCQGGLLTLVKADATELTDRLNADVPKDEQVKPGVVIALQEQAAVVMLRLALEQLLAKGWTTQLAGFVSPDDDVVKGLLDVLRTCGTFAKARPLVESIDELFAGFGGAFGAGKEIRKTIAEIERSPDELEARRAEVRRKVSLAHRGWPPGPGVETIIGLTDDAAAKLVAAGLDDVLALRAIHPAAVAEKTGLDEASLETWRKQADLQARPGISPSTAYACVTFDAAHGGKSDKQSDRVYRHVLALGGGYDPLPDSVEAALYRHGDKLYADGDVPEDPFPYRAGLALDQQSLMALSNLHVEVQVRNVLLDLDSDAARETADGLAFQWQTDKAAAGGLLMPVHPTFFSTTPPPYPADIDTTVSAATAAQASAVVHIVVQGAADQIAFPAGLALTVVPRSVLEADHALAEKHIGPHADAPSYWMRIDALDQLWSQVTTNFVLRELLGDGNFDARSQTVLAHARLEDAQRDTNWDDFAAQFPIYAPVALVHTASMLQALRDRVNQPFGLGSGYRTVANKSSWRRGKLTRSRHMWGTAIDVDTMGDAVIDFVPRPELGGFSRVAWLAHMLLPERYATWDAVNELSPLPATSPADLDHATYVEDSITTGTAVHLHFDWGYPTTEQEEQLIRDNAPTAAPGTGGATGGRAIHLSTAPADAEDWRAGDAAVALAEAMQHHLAAAFRPGAPIVASVPPATVAPNARLAKLVKKGVPALELSITTAMADLFHASPGQLAVFAQAVIGGLLGPDGQQLAVVHGKVLRQDQPNAATQPLARARVGLVLGATTDMSVDSSFGGALGVEYQAYNETLTDEQGRYDLFIVAPARGASVDPVPVRIVAQRAGYGSKRVDYTPNTKPEQEVPDIVLSALQLNSAGGCGRSLAAATTGSMLLAGLALKLFVRRRRGR
jgi:hypothetical protein